LLTPNRSDWKNCISTRGTADKWCQGEMNTSSRHTQKEKSANRRWLSSKSRRTGVGLTYSVPNLYLQKQIELNQAPACIPTRIFVFVFTKTLYAPDASVWLGLRNALFPGTFPHHIHRTVYTHPTSGNTLNRDVSRNAQTTVAWLNTFSLQKLIYFIYLSFLASLLILITILMPVRHFHSQRMSLFTIKNRLKLD